MKNKKYIILIVCIGIYVLISLVFYLFYKNTVENKYFYIIPTKEQYIIWNYSIENWTKVENTKMLDNEFDVYKNGNFIDKYSLVFNKEWYFYDNNNPVEMFNDIYMISSNYDYSSIGYSFEKNVDLNSDINRVLKNKDINLEEYSYEINRYVLKDKKQTEFYTINLYKLQNDYQMDSLDYSFIYSTMNSRLLPIEENSCALNFAGAFEVDNKDMYLISCDYFDLIPSDYYLFEYSDRKFNLSIASKGGI